MVYLAPFAKLGVEVVVDRGRLVHQLPAVVNLLSVISMRSLLCVKNFHLRVDLFFVSLAAAQPRKRGR